GVERGRRRFLEDFLVASLHGALALAEGEHRALSVREELNLDVSRALEVALEVDAVVAERGRGLAPRGRDGVVEFRSRADDAHPAPAAARRRLDEQRRLVDLGHDRHPGFAGDALRLELVPARAQ